MVKESGSEVSLKLACLGLALHLMTLTNSVCFLRLSEFCPSPIEIA